MENDKTQPFTHKKPVILTEIQIFIYYLCIGIETYIDINLLI